MAVNDEWRASLFFSSDALRPEELEAIIAGISKVKKFPTDGSQGNSWHIRYDEVRLRILHKILLNKERDFLRLYSLLTDSRRYYEDAQRITKREVDRIITVLDWPFWQKRSGYFQWLHFNGQQQNYAYWEPETPARLLPLIKILNQTEDAGEYSEDTRSVAMLGMHYFKNFPEDFSFDPGLQAVTYLLNGEDKKADAAFARMAIPEREASIVDQVMAGEQLLEQQLKAGPTHPLEWMMALWCVAWTGVKPRQDHLWPLFTNLASGQYDHIPWVKIEMLNALAIIFPHHEEAAEWKEAAGAQVQGRVFLQSLLPVKEPWEYALRLLAQSKSGIVAEEAPTQPQFRTIWIADFENREVFCKEQKLGKSGWSKGRKLKWYELISPKNAATMDPADANAINAIKTIDGRRLSGSMIYNDDSLYVDFGRMLHEIADHPRIYLGDKKRIPVELIRAEPELQITDTPNGLLMSAKNRGKLPGPSAGALKYPTPSANGWKRWWKTSAPPSAFSLPST